MLSELFVTHDRSRAIDFALPCPEVGHIGLYSQETTADIHKRHPGAVIMDEADFLLGREAQFLSRPVVVISEGEFYGAYEMMPPYYASSDSVAMSFQSSEATSGRITRAYCHVRGVVLLDVRRTRHVASCDCCQGISRYLSQGEP